MGSPEQGDTKQCQDNEEYLATEYLTAALSKDEMITRNRLVISDDIVGGGEYGVVYKGRLDENPVALLTAKFSAGVEYFWGFSMGIKVFNFLGEHPNILRFHGGVVEKIRQFDCVAAFELSPFGNLDNYLRQNAAYYVDITSEENSTQKILPRIMRARNEPIMDINQEVLISFCKQIATAMAYIAEKMVVHRDLSARNVWVFHNNVVKITDFGMSMKRNEWRKYYQCENMPIPWRWMALESLRYMEFSSESDVWNFGVTVWEIFSLGKIPFYGRSWMPDFEDDIEAGLRLLKPEHAPPEVLHWMMKCWENEPERRPSFSDCQEFFTNFHPGIHTEDNV